MIGTHLPQNLQNHFRWWEYVYVCPLIEVDRHEIHVGCCWVIEGTDKHRALCVVWSAHQVYLKRSEYRPLEYRHRNKELFIRY